MRQIPSKVGDEWLATLLLRSELGAEVDRHDDGSLHRMYDLSILHPDGRRGAAEVVSTRDRDEVSQAAEISKVGYVEDPVLTRTWLIYVSRSAHIKDLRPSVSPLLRTFEKRGIVHISRNHGAFCEELKPFPIESCVALQLPTPRHNPGFYLIQSPKSMWGDGDAGKMLEELNNFLRRVPDVAQKLLRSKTTDRHAVVVVTLDQFEFFMAVDSKAVPQEAPQLPAGIDAVWLVAMKGPPLHAAYWLPGGPWRTATLTAEQLRRGSSGS